MGNCKCDAGCDTQQSAERKGHSAKAEVERVTELYVGVFAIPLADNVVAENLMIGARYNVIQATVECHVAAVPNMINLCDEIAADKGWEWRLLRFSEDGVQELDPEDYRSYEDYCVRRSLQ